MHFYLDLQAYVICSMAELLTRFARISNNVKWTHDVGVCCCSNYQRCTWSSLITWISAGNAKQKSSQAKTCNSENAEVGSLIHQGITVAYSQQLRSKRVENAASSTCPWFCIFTVYTVKFSYAYEWNCVGLQNSKAIILPTQIFHFWTASPHSSIRFTVSQILN